MLINLVLALRIPRQRAARSWHVTPASRARFQKKKVKTLGIGSANKSHDTRRMDFFGYVLRETQVLTGKHAG